MVCLRFIIALFLIASFCFRVPAEEVADAKKRVDYQKLVDEKLWITEHYPPYHYFKDGVIDGTMIRALKEVFRRNNILFDVQESFHVFPWARALKELSTNPNAVVVSMGYTQQRSKIYRLTEPVFNETIGLIALKERMIKLENITRLSDFFIGAVRDDIGERLLKDLVTTPLSIAHVQTSDELLEMLVRGRVDMIAYSRQIIDYQINRRGLQQNNFTLVKVLQEVPAAIAFNREGETELFGLMNQTLKEMQKDGTIASIPKQYQE